MRLPLGRVMLAPPLCAPSSPAQHAQHALITMLAASDDAVQWRNRIPNALTVARVLAVPVLAIAFYGGRRVRALPAYLFAACSLTDWLDGYLARRWAVTSELGAFLDPVADKLLVCTCLALLSGELGAVVALPTALIVCREVAVSALREWMGARGARAAVAVGPWGKVKTATQMVALQLLLIAAPYAALSARAAVLLHAGLALLLAATVLTWTSAWGYFAAAAPLLMGADGAAGGEDASDSE